MNKEELLYYVWNIASGMAVNYDNQTDEENSKTLAYVSGICDMAERIMKLLAEEEEEDENKDNN